MTEDQPRSILAALDEVLRDPESAIRNSQAPYPWRLLVGALLGLGLYGMAAGTFQGGEQILVATLKAPMILLAATLLSLPSYYVFVTLAGARSSPRQLIAYLTGFLGVVSLLLAALIPIAWLFSISTRSVGFMGFLHFFAFVFALIFGARFLARCHAEREGRAGLVLWIMLLLLVTVQVSSQLRPVLYRPDSTPLFAPEREFFLKHWGDSFNMKPIEDDRKPQPGSE